MTFSPTAVKLLLSGRTTLTIRPKQAGESSCRWKPGRCYTIQVGRKTKDEVLTVMEAQEMMLGEIPLRTLKRAGFRTTTAFREDWETARPGWIWGDECPVWLISYVLGDHSDTPTFLTAHPGNGPHYVSSSVAALRGEPEAIDRVSQGRYSREAAEGFGTARNAQWEASRERLTSLIGEIKGLSHDLRVKTNVRGLERQIKAIDRKVAA